MTHPILLLAIMVLLGGAFTAREAAAQTVLFDVGHGERFKIEENGSLQLSGFAQVFRTAGIRVTSLEQPISEKNLEGVDGLVISGAFSPLKPEEIDAIIHFIQRGGRLSVMLHIAPPMAPLLDRLQIGHTNGIILETENIIGNEPLNFRVNRFDSHPVLQGIKEVSLYGVWGLINKNDSSRVVASTSSQAWVDLDGSKIKKKETTFPFGVMVAGELGKGGFLVFGDDAIFQNKFLDNNKALAANLANWLKQNFR